MTKVQIIVGLIALAVVISFAFYVWINKDKIADAIDEIKKNEDENGWF